MSSSPEAVKEYNASNYFTIISTISSVINGLIYFCAAIEFFIVIFFLKEFYYKNPKFFSSYYITMISGYIIDVIVVIFFLIGNYQTNVDTTNYFFRVNIVVQWYGSFYIGPWNTVMVMNRFSAIVLSLFHDNLWRGWKLWGFLCGYMATPFIIEAYSFSNLYCFTVVHLDKNCTAYAGEQQTVIAISNTVFSGVSLAIGLVTALYNRIKYGDAVSQSSTKKYEHRLLKQAIISTILFILYNLCIFWYGFLKGKERTTAEQLFLYKISANLSNFLYSCFHYSFVIIIFYLNQSVREAFLGFYRISTCYRMIFKSNKTQTTGNARSSSNNKVSVF